MFAPDVIEAIKGHAIAEYPHESVGVITADGYLPLPNIAVDPDGKAPPEAYRRHFFLAGGNFQQLLISGAVKALVHSHPDGPEWPSIPDQLQQRAMGVPWGLLMCNHEVASEPYFWGDMFDPPPLLGRDFRFGPSGTDGRGDCGALVRDWYRIERNTLLPDCARDDIWFKRGENLYIDHYKRAGFAPADIDHAEVGDVALMQIRSDVPNHAAVFVGNGLIMHHLEGRLSRIEPLGQWRKYIVGWMRHAV